MVAFSIAVADAANIAIDTDKSDITLDSSWAGDVAPGASDRASFAVDGFYGPFTMSKDMTISGFSSGGWGRFTATPQTFDLCGNTLTLTGSGDAAFQPCNLGPRNHLEFSNGTIAFTGNGFFAIGYNKDSYSGSWLKLSGITMTGVGGGDDTVIIGGGDGGNFNCELKIEEGSSVSIAGNVALSPKGLSSANSSNRLFVDGSTLTLSKGLIIGGGGVLEVTGGSVLSANTFSSGMTAGRSSTLVSNSTVNCSWSYESGGSADCSGDFTEVVGASAKLTAGRFRPGNSAASTTVWAHDGATLQGKSLTYIGHQGPATVVVSNANLSARDLLVGNSAGAAGSKLQILGGSSSLDVTYSTYAVASHEFFGLGGSSSIEIAQGANLGMWAGQDLITMTIGQSSSSNMFTVSGTGTVYSAPAEIMRIGTVDTTGNVIQVSDGATYTIRRAIVHGTNTFKVSNATVNIGHGDGYHTSIIVGESGGGSQLVLAGAAPKINFTATQTLGGIKVEPGSKIVFELPPEPYSVVPINTYWLHMAYDSSGENIGQIDIDVSNIPKTHTRLAYRLLHVPSATETQYLHEDVIARVNSLDSVKAVGGRLAWHGSDLVFSVPGTLGMKIIVR